MQLPQLLIMDERHKLDIMSELELLMFYGMEEKGECCLPQAADSLSLVSTPIISSWYLRCLF